MDDLRGLIAAFRRIARAGMWAYFAVVGVGMLTVSLIAGEYKITVLSVAVLAVVLLRLARFYRDRADI